MVETPRASLKDHWGQDHIKTRLLSKIALLQRVPQRVQPPSGCLLIGPPGSGKTHIMRCLAGELKIPIFTTTGVNLLEQRKRPMFRGETFKHPISECFEKVRKMRPALLFIDEIAPLLKPDCNEGDLLLTEMDGFEKSSKDIFVVGATNQEWALMAMNPAFKRAGRFEEVLKMELPSPDERRSIIQDHYPTLFSYAASAQETERGLTRIVRRTAQWTPASIKQMFRDSLVSAAEQNREVTLQDLENASKYLKFPYQRQPEFARPLDNKLTAWHEAGHAVVQIERFPYDPIDFVSIEPGYDLLGFMSVCTDESRHCLTKQDIRYCIQVALAGREAECLSSHGSDNDLIHNTGASNDLKVATRLGRGAVLSYGLDEEYGPIVYSLASEDADKPLPPFEQELVKAWIDKELAEVRALLKSKLPALRAVSQALMSKKSLNNDQLVELIKSAKDS